MTAIQIVGAVMLAGGMVAVLRSVIIVTGGGPGRFRLDPWLPLVAGFGLIILGQAFIR